MAGRLPQVRRKNGHWFSEAGGVGRYFGRCDEVSQMEAMSRLYKALAGGEDSRMGFGVGGEAPGLGDGRSVGKEGINSRRSSPVQVNSFLPSRPTQKAKALHPEPHPHLLSHPTLSVSALRDKYLDWLLRHRSPALHREAKRHLHRWCEAYGQMQATSIEGRHLEAFQESLMAQGTMALMYVKKHATSVRAMFSKGVKMGWLPAGFKPFTNIEGIRLDPKPLLEGDLPTREEVQALMAAAKGDMADIIAVYHATGMRTHELIEARVGDFQPVARTIVLGRHKRSKTLREPIPRTVTLNATAYAIIQRRCEGREPQALIFPNRAGKPYTSVLLDDRFATLRRRAGVREGITPYSFRHLYISEMLMAGVDALLVAKMAGTSVKMVETTYGHFRVASYQDAQTRLDAVRRGVSV